jgi:hypothetical protein
MPTLWRALVRVLVRFADDFVPFALYGLPNSPSLPQANFLGATEPRAARTEELRDGPMVQVARRPSSRTVAWNAGLGRPGQR